MNLKTVHEPEEELLNGQDAWQDFLTLKTIEEGEKKKLIVLDRATKEIYPRTNRNPA
ncbi:MAG: hypothetical protein ONB05_06520 [candidate division KSB1 bacterium]|nr:hypothetical protein [candidate division KSB1 bacterium]